jgi:hypothetical protein
MKAKEIVPGSCFKLSPRKRKFMWAKNIFPITTGPINNHGKLLIICDDCSQIVLNPEADVVELGEILKPKTND